MAGHLLEMCDPNLGSFPGPMRRQEKDFGAHLPLSFRESTVSSIGGARLLVELGQGTKALS